jgi:hypothetical protein
MSAVQPVGTFCYRLLVQPELGMGLGNTVYVGLDVRDLSPKKEPTMAFRFRVDRVAKVAGLTTVDGDLLSGEIGHGDIAIVPTQSEWRVKIRTVAFVHAKDRTPSERTLTIEPMPFPVEQLIGQVLVKED